MTVQSPEIQLISNMATALLKCVDRTGIARVLLNQLSDTLGAQGGSVFQLRNNNLHRLASLDPRHVPAILDFPIQPGTPFGRCAQEKAPIRLDMGTKTADVAGSGWGGYERDTCLLLPMLDQANVILGIVSLHNKRESDFNDSDLEMGALLTTLATESMRGIAAREEAQLLAMAVDQVLDAIVVTDADGKLVYQNPAAMSFCPDIAATAAETYGQVIEFIRPEHPQSDSDIQRAASLERGERWKGRVRRTTANATSLEIEETISPVRDGEGNLLHFVHVLHDVTREAKLHSQLFQAQKMEAVGALASGIAHEINTPTQYIGDNNRFFQSSFTEIAGVLALCKSLLAMDDTSPDLATARAALRTAMDKADLDFLLEEIPVAIEQSLEGNQRVADIVRAMKEFAHPGTDQFEPANINACLTNTIAVSRNEWKYVAELNTAFDQHLPEVLCDASALNQVFLNMIVNAGHAIADMLARQPDARGRITIRTMALADAVEIRIEDNGRGIDPALQQSIFDPFFTTKPVGKGTGQGLAISHNVIVEQHGGSIDVESAPGKGTTFIIRIPTAPADTEMVH